MAGGGSASLRPASSSSDGDHASEAEVKELQKKLRDMRDRLKASEELSPAQQLGLTATSRRRKRKCELSSDSDDESGFHSGFGPVGDRRLVEMAACAPGHLYDMAVSELQKFIGNDVTEGSDPTHLPGRAFTNMFFTSHPAEKIGAWKAREMQTLCAALDALKGGSLPRVADLLAQRLKACETAVQSGNLEAATQLELIPSQEVGLTSLEEKRAARRASLMDRKLKNA